MNIDRANPGMPLAPAVRPSGRFDLTVSDRGVQRESAPPPRPVPESRPGVQITSEPALQELLSAEETEALRESFPARARDLSRTGRAAEAGIYGMGGATAPARQAAALGRLVDFSG